MSDQKGFLRQPRCHSHLKALPNTEAWKQKTRASVRNNQLGKGVEWSLLILMEVLRSDREAKAPLPLLFRINISLNREATCWGRHAGTWSPVRVASPSGQMPSVPQTPCRERSLASDSRLGPTRLLSSQERSSSRLRG